MKKIYWRPARVSRIELVLVALLAVAGLMAVELLPVIERQPFYREKLRAARLTRDAFTALRDERLRRKLPFSEDGDPMKSGMIGELISPIVTNTGSLPSKQTSVNPNFGALLVHYLKKLDVNPGDVVAVGASGSFPAINVAVYAALTVLEIEPLIICSASASQWGSTHSSFTWLDMERVLRDKRMFPFASLAASRGGIDDRALGLDKAGKQLLDEAIQRNGVTALQPRNYAESVDLRMAVYQEHAGDRPIKAYINIGGGTSSVGTKVGKRMFKPGINRRAPEGMHEIDSVMLRFAEQGVPVIHMVKILDQAQRYGFPMQPETMPPIGQGKIYSTMAYNKWLAWAVLIVLLGALVAFMRLHLGMRLFGTGRGGASGSQPSEMV